MSLQGSGITNEKAARKVAQYGQLFLHRKEINKSAGILETNKMCGRGKV